MSVVVVATNGSPACRRAVERAAELFETSELVVAMVVPTGPVRCDGSDIAVVRVAANQIAVDSAAQTVAESCEGLGTRARPVVLGGDPSTALCAMARAEGAEAIVVGSLGSGPLAAALCGSIGAELLERAPCSVIELGGEA